MIVTTHRGMGDALIAPPTYENCDPRDTACTIRNQQLNTTYNVAVQDAQAQNNYDQCLANAANATSDAQRNSVLASCSGQFVTQAPVGATPIQQVMAAPSNSSQLASVGFTFRSSGSDPQTLNNNVDTWTAIISGAAPNSPVSVSATVGNTVLGQSVVGVTDGSGNFTKSAVASGTLGNWHEVWYVGDQAVGNIWFNLVSPTTTPTSQASSGAIVTPSTSGTTVPASNPTGVFDLFGDTSNPISIGSFQIGEYTAIGLAAAIAVVLVMMTKGR